MPVRDVREIGAVQAIAQVIAQHSRGLDRADEGLIAGCYHPGADIDYGFFRGPAADFAAIVAPALRSQAITQHRTGHMWILIDGDTARSESAVIAYSLSPDADGTPMQRLICGRYLDRHARRDGVWRLTHRTYVLDTNVNHPGDSPAMPLSPLSAHVPAGGHGAADAGIALLARMAARNTILRAGVPAMPTPTPDRSDIDAILSRQQIADLTMACCRGIDRADEDLLKSVFHEDSVVVSGVFNGSGPAYAEEICRILRAVFDQTFHSIANQWIEVTGDTAIGETYVIAVSTMTDMEQGKSEMLTGGRYLDRFERRDGVWKIAERTFVSDWSRVDRSSAMDDGPYAALQLRGAQGPEDPVYRFWH